VIIGEAAHTIDPSMYHQPSIFLEDAYTLAKYMIDKEDISKGLELYNSRNDKVKYIEDLNKKFRNYFGSFRVIKIFKPFKIFTMLYKSFFIIFHFKSSIKNLNKNNIF
jgi:hypothetical protein